MRVDNAGVTGDAIAPLGNAQLEAWRLFLQAHARTTEVLARELESEAGLPLNWYDVLIQLDDAGGRLRMHDLARAVLLSRAGLTRLVDRVSAAGLVRREPCEDDRRGTFVILNEAGKKRLEAARPVHHHGINTHFGAHLSDDEAKGIRAAFERVLEALGPDAR